MLHIYIYIYDISRLRVKELHTKNCDGFTSTSEHKLVGRAFDSINSLFSGIYETPEFHGLVMSSTRGSQKVPGNVV